MLFSRASLFFSITLTFSAALALPIVDSSNGLIPRSVTINNPPGTGDISKDNPECVPACIHAGIGDANHCLSFCELGEVVATGGDDDDTSDEDDTTNLPAPDNAACVSVCLNAGLITGPDAPAGCQDFCDTESEG